MYDASPWHMCDQFCRVRLNPHSLSSSPGSSCGAASPGFIKGPYAIQCWFWGHNSPVCSSLECCTSSTSHCYSRSSRYLWPMLRQPCCTASLRKSACPGPRLRCSASKQGECGCPGSVLGRRVSSGCAEYECNQPPWHPSVCPSGGGWGSHGSKPCLLAESLALQWEAACCCGCSGCAGYSCRSPAPSLIARTPVQRPSMLERS